MSRPNDAREPTQWKGAQMAGTFQAMVELKAWQRRHEPNAPKAGDCAPDFELRDTEGKNPVRLSDFQGKAPVALIFGSYT
jgi:hypothetical protein